MLGVNVFCGHWSLGLGFIGMHPCLTESNTLNPLNPLTSSKGYRSLARRNGNKPMGSYSAKSSTICMWYPCRGRRAQDGTSTWRSSTSAPTWTAFKKCACNPVSKKQPQESFESGHSTWLQFQLRQPCPAISSCAKSSFKYLSLLALHSL